MLNLNVELVENHKIFKTNMAFVFIGVYFACHTVAVNDRNSSTEKYDILVLSFVLKVNNIHQLQRTYILIGKHL